MIDIHTHLLPMIDDGAKTIDESMLILRKASAGGIKTLVATPHILDYPSDQYLQKIRIAFAELSQRFVAEGVNIRLKLGAELFISPDLPLVIKENPQLTVNGGNRFVLTELPMLEIPPYAEQTFERLLRGGITPIIAHPERCMAIKKSPDRLADFVREGILTQLNVGSLTGAYGRRVKKISKKLLANDLVHFIATDVHAAPSGSYPLKHGLDVAASIVGRGKAMDMVTTMPANII